MSLQRETVLYESNSLEKRGLGGEVGVSSAVQLLAGESAWWFEPGKETF